MTIAQPADSTQSTSRLTPAARLSRYFPALNSFLVARLRLVTRCRAGSACRIQSRAHSKRSTTRGGASSAVRSQAEPGNEKSPREIFPRARGQIEKLPNQAAGFGSGSPAGSDSCCTRGLIFSVFCGTGCGLAASGATLQFPPAQSPFAQPFEQTVCGTR